MTNEDIHRLIDGVADQLKPFAEGFVKDRVDEVIHRILGDAAELRGRVKREIHEAVRQAIEDTVSVHVCIKP